jgi:predicted outer membrane repeat protein
MLPQLSSFSKAPMLLLIVSFVMSWFSFPNGPFELPSAQAADQIWYVNHAATGANNGTSWMDAFTTVQSAISAAQADDEIWVARGVYYTANNVANSSSSFLINKPIRIYGGFVGGETKLTQRNWDQNKTILSGDIERNDTYSGTYGIVTNPTHIFGTNARNVVRITNAGAGVVLDGFVITGGKITDISDDMANFGAGMVIITTHPTIRNVVFSGNAARNGGALYNESSGPTISNSSFVGNNARTSGGAIYSDISSHFNLSNSSFIQNSAAHGGAISTISSNPVISHTSFYSNTATIAGGALSNAGASPQITHNTFVGNSASDAGGAISNVSSTIATITNNTFSHNTALIGGAIRNHSSPTTNISNNTFSKNSATSGGAIANMSTGGPTISANTFSANNANNGGAVYIQDSKPTINNNVFTANTATNGGAINNNGSDGIISNNSFSGQNANSGGALYVNNSLNPQVTNNTFSANTALIGAAFYSQNSTLAMNNSAFAGNAATNAGGSIYTVGGNITITNSSFAGNNVSSTNNAAAIHGVNSSRLDLINSIVWGNEASVFINASSSITITNSLVEGCNPAGVWGSDCGSNGGNNLFDSNPLFVNPVSYTSAPTNTADLRLQVASPAVNAGNNALNTSANDLDGNPRIIDGRIDLGAYEALPRLNTFVVGSGTISYSPALEAIPVGTTLTVTATAKPGWSFAGWGGDLSGTNAQTSLLINATKSITATFSNNPPIANAGADQSVVAGSSVTLNGSASYDADPTQTITYAWTQTAGTPVTLTGASTAQPTFTAPNAAGALTFSLLVTDSLGLASSADTVTITVTNDAPIANAGADQSVVAGNSVSLNGSASSDPDGHTPITYGWTQSGGTAVSLSDPSAVSPTFTAPNLAGTLTFSLIVTDSTGLASSADTVTITVTNDAPNANAGNSQAVLAGASVTLDGSGSSDPDGHMPITYGWTQTSGTPVTLNSTSAISPTFTAPNVAGALTFSLIVTDSVGLASAADTVTITVTNDAPNANAGNSQAVLAGASVTLDGSGSSDPDGHTPLAFGWTQTSGTPVTLNSTSAISPTFTAPSVTGVLSFSLVVTDSMGLVSATDSVTVTVTNGEPVADAGADQTVLTGSFVTLDGSGSSDPDGHTPLAFGWTQTSGTPVTLNSTSAISPTFTTPSVTGVLSFSLIVTDSMGLASATDSVTITVEKPIYTVYLPTVLGQEQRPNLVITELKADQNGLQVVISNTGDAPNSAGFWIDLYVNPRQAPTANTVWQKIAPVGAVWMINQTLEPGQSITLSQTSPFFVPDYSFGSFAVGDQLYAYVDSYHSSNSYGVELESDESDNRYGPVTARGAGNLSLPSAQQTDPSRVPNR